MLDVYFWIFAVIAGLCACGLLVARHPIAGAVNLIGVMLALAGIYGLLDAAFLGVVQILVYAGAIMMLIVFVIMVLNSATDHAVPRGGPARLVVGLAAAAVLAMVAISALLGSGLADAARAPVSDVRLLGAALFDTGPDGRGWYVLFELTGLLLLAGMVAAIQLAKRSLASPEPAQLTDDAQGHGGHA